MKAEDARRLTQESLLSRDGVAGRLLDYVHKRIDAAARRGQRKLYRPLDGTKLVYEQAHADAVYARLREDGFDVTYHGDYDHSDPRESPWWEVAW